MGMFGTVVIVLASVPISISSATTLNLLPQYPCV